MTEKDEQLLIRSLIKKVGPVDMNLVMGADRLPSGKYLIKLAGRRASDNEVDGIRREAELFEKTMLFKMITETLRYQAQQTMFEKSEKAEHVFLSGKFLLHAISTLEHMVWAVKNPQLLAEEKVINTPSKKRLDGRVRSLNN